MKVLAMAASDSAFSSYDQQSLTSVTSSRRPSPLTAMMPKTTHFAQTRRPSHSASIESDHHSLHQVDSNQSASSNFSGFRGNYQLNRVDSRTSVSSALSGRAQYKVSLDLSSKEISLLRYMWNKMLTEDHASEESQESASTLPIPGSLWTQAQKKTGHSTVSRSAIGASSTFCVQLYQNLLAMDTSLETLFPSLRHQAVSMAGVLSLAVKSLDNLSQLDEYLVKLGNRHLRILGIEPAQFELLGEAFIQTFHERFGTRFTHELEVLWIKFYMYLANSLLQFGLDPVLRAAETPEGAGRNFRMDSVTDSIFTAESEDALSMSNSARRESTSTDVSSIANMAKQPLAPASVRHGSLSSSVNAISGKFGMHSASASAQASQPSSPKKKRGRLGRTKGDCTIM